MNAFDPSPSSILTTPHLLHGRWDKEAQHYFFSDVSAILVYLHCQNYFGVKKKWKLEVTGCLHVKSWELCLLLSKQPLVLDWVSAAMCTQTQEQNSPVRSPSCQTGPSLCILWNPLLPLDTLKRKEQWCTQSPGVFVLWSGCRLSHIRELGSVAKN